MAPLFAFGHACEFLVAKVEITRDLVILEITADYGGNPMIADEEAARVALKNILQIHAGGQTHALETLAPLNFEHRQQWDPATPANFSPPPDGQTHQLLTAVWRWKPKAREIAFGVPDGSPNDVLLWTTAGQLPGKDVQWMLLIEGESTPAIQLPRHSGMTWTWITGAVAMVLMLTAVRRRI